MGEQSAEHEGSAYRKQRLRKTKAQLVDDLEQLEVRLADQERSHTATPQKAEFAAGATIYKQGDAADAVYFILRGKVRFQRQAADAASKKITEVKDGAMFGELALCDDRPRAATAVAVDKTLLIRMTRDEYRERLSGMDLATRHIVDSMVLRIRNMVDEFLQRKAGNK